MGGHRGARVRHFTGGDFATGQVRLRGLLVVCRAMGVARPALHRVGSSRQGRCALFGVWGGLLKVWWLTYSSTRRGDEYVRHLTGGDFATGQVQLGFFVRGFPFSWWGARGSVLWVAGWELLA